MKNGKVVFIATALAAVLVSAVLITFAIDMKSQAPTEDVVRGDVNGDGAADTVDLILLRQYFANYDYTNQNSTVEICEGADANLDGAINTSDIIAIRLYLVNGEWTNRVQISENGGVASVTVNDDFQYTATGYKSVENGNFVFDTGLEISFEDGLFAEDFNRIYFDYNVTEPIQVFVTYTLDGEEKTDYFFLQPTKNSFRGLIEGYLADKKGAELKKLTVDTCEEVEASFILNDLYTEVIPLYEDDLCVENERYKIGCRLSWGGAMTYFEDKLDGDDALGNLVNIHDTGRLIQQSFYGTSTNDEGYVSVPNGGEGATLWPYNPVQGGDRKNNGSDRLIDVEYDEEKDYIYIVSQALDWAYVKGETYETEYQGLTYTYYENTYSIIEGDEEDTADDYVLVDNVATDFSGWTHVAGGQEIPAVYLVSFFDNFSYYNGVKPWTGDLDGVQYESQLVGWENAGNFPLYRGNTETWSIWINSDADFGFGTYCPNIQKHIAIRHKYDGSKDPMANSTSYVAPSCSIVMQSYKPIEYSYILATGSPEDIREIFTENKDFTDNASLSEDRYDQLVYPERFDMMDMDFTVEDSVNIFYAPKHLDISYDQGEEALKIYVENGRDPYASLNFDLNAQDVINSDDFNTIEIEYMLPVTNSKPSSTLVLFMCAGDVGDYKDNYTVSGTVIRDGKYHTLSLRVPKSKCQGDLHKFRFDPFPIAEAGDIMYVKRISLTKVDYPSMSVENDLSMKGSEYIFSSLALTEAAFDESESAVKLTTLGENADVSFTLNMSELNLNAMEYVTFQIEYMMPASNSKSEYVCTLYYDMVDNKGFAEGQKACYDKLIADGEYHTLTINMSSKELWKGIINNLRFDYSQGNCAKGDVIYIKSVSLGAVSGFDVDLSQNENGEYFSSAKYTEVYFDESEDALRFEVSGGNDVNVTLDLSDYSLSTDEYTYLFIRYMIPYSNSQSKYAPAVYFTTDESGSYSEDKAIYGDRMAVDGNYHTLIIDMTQKGTWTGNIAKIRFDYFQSDCSDGDVIYIKSMSFK